MTLFQTPRRALKRGALIAAANWPIIIVQASADALFKLVIAVPFIAGVALVALIVGAEPNVLLGLELKDMAVAVYALLLSRPLALAAFASAMAVAVAGGSLFVFLIKGGTVGLLVEAERQAGAVEEPPLRAPLVGGAAVFSVERFIDGCRALFPRFFRLGCVLLGVYLASGAVFVAAAFGRPVGDGWLLTALLTVGFVLWITAVNLLYLLAQIVIAAENCGVAAALRRVAAFLRREPRTVLGVCAVVLGLVVLATAASLVATTALGLIGFVPFIGLAVLPLQLMAWLLRGLVLQFITQASVGAYSALYRGQPRARVAPIASTPVPEVSPGV